MNTHPGQGRSLASRSQSLAINPETQGAHIFRATSTLYTRALGACGVAELALDQQFPVVARIKEKTFKTDRKYGELEETWTDMRSVGIRKLPSGIFTVLNGYPESEAFSVGVDGTTTFVGDFAEPYLYALGALNVGSPNYRQGTRYEVTAQVTLEAAMSL